MLVNLEKQQGSIEFNAPLIVAAPTYNIIDELKEEGDWDTLQKYSGFEFNDDDPKGDARLEYENMMYLERPGCNLCMGNQEKAAKGDTVMATSTRLVPRPRGGGFRTEKRRVPAFFQHRSSCFRQSWEEHPASRNIRLLWKESI